MLFVVALKFGAVQYAQPMNDVVYDERHPFSNHAEVGR
jgi:hypothetical protein